VGTRYVQLQSESDPDDVDCWVKWCLLRMGALVCHSRGRSLDMSSPVLRICMESARAKLALAVAADDTKARAKETQQGLLEKTSKNQAD